MKDIVSQYIMFTRILAEQELKHGRTRKAILETIRICIDQNVLREYLERREPEVVSIMMSLYDQERAVKEYADEKAIDSVIELARQVKMTDRQIEEYIMNKFDLTKEEADKYLEPVYT